MPILDTPSRIRDSIGRKSPDDIRALAAEQVAGPVTEWLTLVADRLQAAGFCTLNDVTDDEFDDIVAKAT